MLPTLRALLKPVSGATLEDYIATQLPNVPSGRRSAIATIATTAATNASTILGSAVTGTTVIDAIVSMNWFAGLRLEDGCLFTDTSATTLINANGQFVAAIRNWKNNTVFATQSTSGFRPTATTSDGLRFNGQTSKQTLNLLAMNTWTSGEGIIGVRTDLDLPGNPSIADGSNIIGYWSGSNTPYRYSDGNVYDGFGRGTRMVYTPTMTINVWRCWDKWAASGDHGARLDGVQQATSNTSVSFTSLPRIGGNNSNESFLGNIKLLAFTSRKLTTTERVCLERFCMAY